MITDGGDARHREADRRIGQWEGCGGSQFTAQAGARKTK
jgi:hypothetical protein